MGNERIEAFKKLQDTSAVTDLMKNIKLERMNTLYTELFTNLLEALPEGPAKDQTILNLEQSMIWGQKSLCH